MIVLLLCCIALAQPTPSTRAQPQRGVPSLDAAARLHGPAVVGVWAGKAMSAGFLVSSSGAAVTVLPPGHEGELVVEFTTAERRRARVLAVDDDGLALLQLEMLEKDAVFSSLGLAPLAAKDATPKSDAWLLSLSFVDGRAVPFVGGLRRVDDVGLWQLDLPVAAGAPVLAGGLVVAVVLRRVDATSSVAVPATRIQALVQRVR